MIFSFVLIDLLLPLICFSSAAKSWKYSCRYSRQNALLKTSLKLHIATGMELPIPVLLCIILMYPYACGRWVCWASDEFDCQKVTCTQLKDLGKKGGGRLQHVCGLESCPLLITASVPCDSFHLDQFNKLTDTNFHYCQHGTANTGAKDHAPCCSAPPVQRGHQPGCVSGLLAVGTRMDWWWEKVIGWFFDAPAWGCRLNNMKCLDL